MLFLKKIEENVLNYPEKLSLISIVFLLVSFGIAIFSTYAINSLGIKDIEINLNLNYLLSIFLSMFLSAFTISMFKNNPKLLELFSIIYFIIAMIFAINKNETGLLVFNIAVGIVFIARISFDTKKYNEELGYSLFLLFMGILVLIYSLVNLFITILFSLTN